MFRNILTKKKSNGFVKSCFDAELIDCLSPKIPQSCTQGTDELRLALPKASTPGLGVSPVPIWSEFPNFDQKLCNPNYSKQT